MKKKSKISLIITVKNEQSSIIELLESIVAQTRRPNEVVIVDGESTDNTFNLSNNFIEQHQSDISWKLLRKESNISTGRNLAISKAQHDLIAITDAGCVLEQDWLEQLELCYLKHPEGTVVAGFYKGLPRTAFEEAVVPYVLVMPDQVDAETFLPATRSMLLPKKMWEVIGGFDENLTVSEDFAFAHQIVKKYGQQAIVFCEQAVVGWRPRSSFKQFFTMLFKMAEGDVRAEIYRGKVKLLFGRYIGGLFILVATIKASSLQGLLFLIVGFLTYLAWSIRKNKRYAPSSWHYLPLLQIVADISVMSGSLSGLWYCQTTLSRK